VSNGINIKKISPWATMTALPRLSFFFYNLPQTKKSITSSRLIETKSNRSGRKTTRTVISCQTRQSYHSKLAKERKEEEKHLNNDHQHSAELQKTLELCFVQVGSSYFGWWLVCFTFFREKKRKEEEEVCSFLLLPQLTRATLKKRIEIWPTV
jgi:hypothetical protein